MFYGIVFTPFPKNMDMNKDQRKPNEAPGGNASNPSPDLDPLERKSSDQLIDEKGVKYLREVASIEDLPDAEEEEEDD